jgi:phosphatidylinositol glycan class B
MAADRLSAFFPPGNAIRSAIVIVSPRILQAVIAALGDWYTWHLAANIYGSDSNASFFAVSASPPTLFLSPFLNPNSPLTQ